MNDKYFDANLFEELPADHFHKKVLEHATCIASNLMSMRPTPTTPAA